MRLQHVVGGSIPQTQMHWPACREKPMVAGIEGHPSRGDTVILSSLLDLVNVQFDIQEWRGESLTHTAIGIM